jgi:seryl-tRNA synthetase
MHDPRALLGLGDAAVRALGRRGYALDLDALAELTSRRATTLDLLGKLRAEANRLARAARPGDAALAAPAASDAARRDRRTARLVKERVVQLETELRQTEAELSAFLLAVPNLPDEAVPDGGEADAVELRRVGRIPSFDFEPADHGRLGERMGILDLKRAGKISGTRFCVLGGAGAAVERALASFFLDLHTGEHGYRECSVPSLVTREAMTGTGQLPKFEADLFRTSAGGRELFLIPTAEVPLINLYAGELLDPSALPIALTACTRCFRAEAGSYGQDTRGILRQHEFGKVELVRLCAPEHASTELTVLVGHAEACLRRLGLAYRVVLLAARDTGFSARMTYDLEVWLPGQGRYREISSCSDCGPFQARRAKIRVRHPGGGNGPAATLNGSGLPLGRTLLAILEQYQQADGSVLIPPALVPYTRFRRIDPDGAVTY